MKIGGTIFLVMRIFVGRVPRHSLGFTTTRNKSLHGQWYPLSFQYRQTGSTADFHRSCPQAQSWFYNYTEQGYTVTVVRLHGTRLAQRTQTESTTGLNPGRQLAHATLHGNNIDTIAERTCTIKLWRRRPYSWQPACTPASIQGQCLMLLAEPVLTGGAS